MHRLHRETGHHAHNYADIVWWDMLFGPDANPRASIDECRQAHRRRTPPPNASRRYAR